MFCFLNSSVSALGLIVKAVLHFGRSRVRGRDTRPAGAAAAAGAIRHVIIWARYFCTFTRARAPCVQLFFGFLQKMIFEVH